MMSSRILLDEKFGDIRALRMIPAPASARGQARKNQWFRVRCEKVGCDGTEWDLPSSKLNKDGPRMCKPCAIKIQTAAMALAKTTHGATGTPLYETWEAMGQRCRNAAHPEYADYGGRGISICERWSGPSGFKHFREDMGERPSDSHSIDRKNNGGNYEPENCRWATVEQNNNTRRNVHVEAFGRRLTLAQWECGTGVRAGLIQYRVDNGWAPEEAIATPPRAMIRTAMLAPDVAKRLSEISRLTAQSRSVTVGA